MFRGEHNFLYIYLYFNSLKFSKQVKSVICVDLYLIFFRSGGIFPIPTDFCTNTLETKEKAPLRVPFVSKIA